MQPAVKYEDSNFACHGWSFMFRSSGIIPSVDYEGVAKDLGLRIMPALYYGQSFGTLSFPAKGVEITFDPKEALRPVNFKVRADCTATQGQSSEVKTKHYAAWKDKAVDPSIELAEVKQVGDSFLATPYRGQFAGLKATVVVLFEDELDDNGFCRLELRFRVMGDSFFGLLRYFLRVDDVVIRLYDTRFYT
ncbi:TIP41-like protein, partial [Hippocampus zosterae]|uniref:TIP41-like protein n=1 Tax=Hippocampus zosterae TaxID=109293 RepID=UPI00223D111B